MPSTMSSWVSRPLASSTVMTPSLPTFSMASAIISPMVRSPLADTVPTWAISSLPLVDFDCFLSSSTTAVTDRSMPRLRFIGSCPAATILAPSVKMERARTVAVVVPSPATSDVLLATSFTICAPMFSNLSGSSISLATVTPSLVTLGAPQDFSSTTLRPRGPRVTVTASARTLTPRSTLARASSLNFTIFAGMSLLLRFLQASDLDDTEDIFLTQDEVLLAVDLDLRPRIFAEQDPVARLHVEGDDLAVLVDLPLAYRDDLALLGLLLRGVGDDDATRALLLLLLEPLDDQPISQRPDPGCHDSKPPSREAIRPPGASKKLFVEWRSSAGRTRVLARRAHIRSSGLAVKGGTPPFPPAGRKASADAGDEAVFDPAGEERGSLRRRRGRLELGHRLADLAEGSPPTQGGQGHALHGFHSAMVDPAVLAPDPEHRRGPIGARPVPDEMERPVDCDELERRDRAQAGPRPFGFGEGQEIGHSDRTGVRRIEDLDPGPFEPGEVGQPGRSGRRRPAGEEGRQLPSDVADRGMLGGVLGQVGAGDRGEALRTERGRGLLEVLSQDVPEAGEVHLGVDREPVLPAQLRRGPDDGPERGLLPPVQRRPEERLQVTQ